MPKHYWRLNEIQKYADERLAKYNQEGQHKVEKQEFPINTQCTLKGVVFTHPEYTQHMIVFSGMMQYSEHYVEREWALHTTTASNIHSFNYRGTSHNDVDPSEETLISDGVSIVKQVLGQGVDPKKIVLYGTSLGGGIAILVAAKLADEGIHVYAVVNERSFSSLTSASSAVFGKLFSTVLHASTNWELDAAAVVDKIKGKIIVIYHPNDYYVRKIASFEQAIRQKNLPNATFIEMDDNNEPWLHEDKIGHWLHKGHCRDLNNKELLLLNNDLKKEPS